eukprot:9198203-Pyramimonas_sp.AAC.1
MTNGRGHSTKYRNWTSPSAPRYRGISTAKFRCARACSSPWYSRTIATMIMVPARSLMTGCHRGSVTSCAQGEG